ncbi:hypothetical protein RvY_07230-2 [Ramazzottius varieornatus]|uniref:Sugar phosphate phosphatase n=1 Tax=Ramazzottius varieornatus TaxID=947166 RepID=A0A1D1V4L7_RAMVA|nr:hypothetical protein RvY_07230-2 [Ramazzottius varieornatus]
MTQVANTHHESLQSHDPRNRNETPFPLSAFDTKSFAYHTIQTRLPIILTRIVDHLSRYKSQVYGEKELEDAHHAHPGGPQEAWNVRRQEAEEDLKYVLGALAKLRNEMQTNKTMTPFPSSRSLTPASASADEFITDDLEEWNHAFTTKIAQNVVNPEDLPKWFEVSFLFAECYLYRRISLAIQETKHLKRLDPFKWQKAESLRDCTETIHSLLNNLSTIMAKALASDKSGPETFEDSFHQFLRVIYIEKLSQVPNSLHPNYALEKGTNQCCHLCD